MNRKIVIFAVVSLWCMLVGAGWLVWGRHADDTAQPASNLPASTVDDDTSAQTDLTSPRSTVEAFARMYINCAEAETVWPQESNEVLSRRFKAHNPPQFSMGLAEGCTSEILPTTMSGEVLGDNTHAFMQFRMTTTEKDGDTLSVTTSPQTFVVLLVLKDNAWKVDDLQVNSD